MSRSRRVAVLLALLAWSPALWAQAPEGPVVSIRELDGPEQRCRVIRTWTMEGGSRAWQVQVLDTAEMLTVVESGPAPGAGGASMTASIYHWGLSETPPRGVPVPPDEPAAPPPVARRPLPPPPVTTQVFRPEVPRPAPPEMMPSAPAPAFGYHPTRWRPWPGAASPSP
jgi:hypothetical protein